MTQQSEEYTTNAQADTASRAFGLVLLCIGFGIAYFVWPAGITESTLAAVTFGALLRAVAAFGIGIASLVIAVMFWM